MLRFDSCGLSQSNHNQMIGYKIIDQTVYENVHNTCNKQASQIELRWNAWMDCGKTSERTDRQR